MENVANDLSPASPELPAPRDERSPARSTPGLTVRRALEVPALAGARVLAGHDGLDRVVQRGNVMEVPDILPWVKPHELLLTTGYPLRNTPRGLPALVAALDARGLAALGVKLHRYLDGLPEEMLDEANRLGLPLLLVPDAVGFDDILNQVLTRVLNRQTAVLERTWAVHDVLVALVLEGGGLHELAAETGRVLEASVAVTTSEGRILAEGGEPAGPEGWWRDRSPAGRWQAVVPIVAGREDHGYLVARSRDRELDDADVDVLERAATVAALVVTKQLAVGAVEGKYRGDFLRDMLAGRAGRLDKVVSHCDVLGWDVDRPLVVIVAELDPRPGPQLDPQPRSAQERFAVAWQAAAERVDPRAAVVGFTQEVVALLGISPDGGADAAVGEVLRRIFGDGRSVRRSFSTGVSRVVTDLAHLPEAYGQALDAVHVGRRMHGDGSVAHFDSLGSFRLLSQIPDTDELRDFVRETLREIAPDAPAANEPMSTTARADLRHTLQVLLDSNLNVAQAARQLHFHYNTLRYRIGKLEAMLGAFTTDPELRLDLALALKVLQMRGLPRG